MDVFQNTSHEKIDNEEPIKVTSDAYHFSALDSNAAKAVSAFCLRHEDEKTVDIVAHLEKITKEPYPL